MRKKTLFLLLLLSGPLTALPKSQEIPSSFLVEVHTDSSRGIDNKMQWLSFGLASLQKRIDLIRKAKKRISLEYFIWRKDLSGLIVFHELIKRAQEGIEIRIILDKSMTVIEMDEFYSEALAKYGIQLHHYNRSLDPVSAQFRNHRKFMVIDGEEAILGGRNIGDEYFDLDRRYNFIDREIYIKGPIAKAIQDSFDIYWNHPIVKKWKRLGPDPHSKRLFRSHRRRRQNYYQQKRKVSEHLRREASDWIESHQQKEVIETIERIEKLGRPLLDNEPIDSCPKVTYVSDLPGASGAQVLNPQYRHSHRLHRQELKKRLFDPHLTELWLMSPYFIPNSLWEEALKFQIEQRKIPVYLYTNSLGSSDNIVTSATFYRLVFSYQEKGLIPYIHDGRFLGLTAPLEPYVAQARWGMHDKTHIYGEDSFYIGTYNIDNRSDYFNTEMGLFCDGGKKLRDRLMENLESRLEKAYQIIGRGKAIDRDGQEADIFGHAPRGRRHFMELLKWPSWTLKFLL